MKIEIDIEPFIVVTPKGFTVETLVQDECVEKFISFADIVNDHFEHNTINNSMSIKDKTDTMKIVRELRKLADEMILRLSNYTTK